MYNACNVSQGAADIGVRHMVCIALLHRMIVRCFLNNISNNYYTSKYNKVEFKAERCFKTSGHWAFFLVLKTSSLFFK